MRIGPHIVGLLLEDAARALVQPGGAGEFIGEPAGSFDTVRFRCGSVVSDSNVHDKQYGLVWVDRNTGLPVRSEMEVHTVYRSNRYRLNEQVVSLGTP